MKFVIILVVLSFLFFFFLVIDAGHTHPTDQAALTAFWHGLSSKGLLDWDTYSPDGLCGQQGVECGIYSPLPDYGKVLSLKLSNSELVGTLASELGQLSFLTFMSFASNSWSGTLPTEYGDLLNLTYLGLSKEFGTTKLTGTIPTQFGRLASLQRLEMRDHAFTGAIPNELGHLSHLTVLNLGTGTQPTGEVARFSGTVPDSLSWLPLFELHLSPTTSNFCPLAQYSSWAPMNDYDPAAGCRGCLAEGHECTRGACSDHQYEWTCLCPQNFTGPTCNDAVFTGPPNPDQQQQQPVVIGLAVTCAVLGVALLGLAFVFWRRTRRPQYPVHLEEKFLTE